ncbi:MAG: hypothetical protein JWQ23_1252 [Herminiimonas sp.]|nr:hypothetical protein [Herminiimonas sp.]
MGSLPVVLMQGIMVALAAARVVVTLVSMARRDGPAASMACLDLAFSRISFSRIISAD